MVENKFPGLYFGVDDSFGNRLGLSCDQEISLEFYQLPDFEMKQFIIKSTILTVILFVIGAILYASVLKEFFIPVLPLIVVFFYIITNLVHAYLLRSAGKSNSGFAARNMAVSFLKMFFYFVVAIVFVILHRENAKVFIANFLVLYVVYTIFEVYEFSKFVRQAK